ncbi:alpha/beta hydrolase [Xenophilus arseniciresistens]|uniref:Alpha/beta hydrolase n=1 Tax=Xenophilus arseniciresistens TaxID=1283306 RepID=A0AAE3T090_9BURK|nr:alpha/beta hydrolase [Xenophilus arseniciresistens]MDA7417350.1 alpha/beta hydrolase [Xenophilus arseniciresistens]
MTARNATSLLAPGLAAGADVPEAELQIPLPGGDTVTARQYGRREAVAGGQPLVLHFHGGTFTCGDLDNGRNVGRLLARSGAVAVSLAYPLAPEYPFPKPIEVGYEVLVWLYKQRVKLAGKGARVFLAGEEAGGNLAAAVAMVARDRDHPPLAGQVLLSPMLDPCAGTASLRAAGCDSTDACKWATGWQQYLKRPMDALHPYAVPGSSLRLSDLAPTLVLVGPDDPMRDEALAYAGRLREAGINVCSQIVSSAANWPEALYEPGESGCQGCELSVMQHFRSFFEPPSLQAQPGG